MAYLHYSIARNFCLNGMNIHHLREIKLCSVLFCSVLSGGQFVYHVVKRFLAPFRSAIISSCVAFSQFIQLSKVLKIKTFLFHFKNTCISSIDVSAEADTRPMRCNVTFRFSFILQGGAIFKLA